MTRFTLEQLIEALQRPEYCDVALDIIIERDLEIEREENWGVTRAEFKADMKKAREIAEWGEAANPYGGKSYTVDNDKAVDDFEEILARARAEEKVKEDMATDMATDIQVIQENVAILSKSWRSTKQRLDALEQPDTERPVLNKLTGKIRDLTTAMHEAEKSIQERLDQHAEAGNKLRGRVTDQSNAIDLLTKTLARYHLEAAAITPERMLAQEAVTGEILKHMRNRGEIVFVDASNEET